MSLARSNMTVQAPRKHRFEPPKTKAEFDRLGYMELMQLHDEYPDIYERFAKPRKGGV